MADDKEPVKPAPKTYLGAEMRDGKVRLYDADGGEHWRLPVDAKEILGCEAPSMSVQPPAAEVKAEKKAAARTAGGSSNPFKGAAESSGGAVSRSASSGVAPAPAVIPSPVSGSGSAPTSAPKPPTP